MINHVQQLDGGNGAAPNGVAPKGSDLDDAVQPEEDKQHAEPPVEQQQSVAEVGGDALDGGERDHVPHGQEQNKGSESTLKKTPRRKVLRERWSFKK